MRENQKMKNILESFCQFQLNEILLYQHVFYFPWRLIHQFRDFCYSHSLPSLDDGEYALLENSPYFLFFPRVYLV